MTLEEKIKSLGYAFRDITYHSDGRYSCRLGGTYTNELRTMRIPHEFWGETPSEAIDGAIYALRAVEKLTDSPDM